MFRKKTIGFKSLILLWGEGKTIQMWFQAVVVKGVAGKKTGKGKSKPKPRPRPKYTEDDDEEYT